MRKALFWLLAVSAFLYASIFPALTIDSLTLLFARPEVYEKSNFLVILFLEVSRLFTSLIGIGVAGYLLIRASKRADARALALFLLFATITYEKVFGGGIIPGPVQESSTLALIDIGVSSRLLRWLFGPQIWTAWPAIAALMRFSAVFPRDLHPAALEASAREDRRGFLRGNAVAGADIGASVRALSRWLLERKAFAPLALSVFAVAMIGIHAMFAHRIPALVFWGIALLLLFIVVTNVRGSYLESDERGRARTAWITLGLVFGLFMFLISTAAFVLIGAPVVRALAFGMMMLVPAVIMTCLALSVAAAGRYDTRSAVHAAVRAGSILFAMMLVLAALFAAADWAKDGLGVPGTVAALAAICLTALAYVPVSRVADGVRRRILEHAANDHQT